MADGSVVIDTKLDESGMNKSLASLGSSVGKGIAVAIGAVTAALGAATGAIIKFGSEYETAAAKASTLFGDVAVDTQNLDKKILALSSSTGIAAAEMQESLYNALSAGIPVTEDMGEAVAFLDQASKLAAAGFTDIDTAVTSTAKVLNAYGMDVAETDRVHKVLMQTQNKGITTVGELGAVLAQVTPTAAAMNFSFEQVGASLATMTAAGTPAAQATTQLNSLLAELGKSGTKASDSLAAATKGTKYAGKSFSELMAEGVPITDLLALISDNADANGLSMLDMFSSIESGKAALSLFNEDGAIYMSTLGEMATEADVVGKAYDTMMNTFSAQKGIFITNAQNLGIAAYEYIQEPLMGAAKFGSEAIGQLSTALSEGGIEGLITAAGDVLSQVVTKVAEFAPKMIDAGVSLLMSLIDGLVVNIDTIAQAAVDIGVSLLNGIIQAVPKLIEGGIKLIAGLAQGIAKALPTIIPALVNGLKDAIKALIDNAPLLLDAAFALLEGLAEGLIEALPVLVEALPILIQSIIDFIIEAIPIWIEAVIQFWSAIIDALPTAITTIVEALPGLINSIINGILGAVPLLIQAGIQLLSSLIGALPEIIRSIVAAIPQIIDGLITAVKQSLPVIIQAGIDLFVALVEALPEIITTIIGVLPTIIDCLLEALTEFLPVIIQAGIDLFIALVEALPTIINAIISVIPVIIDSLIKAIVGAIPLLIQAGIDLFVALIKALPDIIIAIVKAIPKIIDSVISALIDAIPLLIQAGVELFVAIVENLPTIIWEIIKAIPKIIKAIVDAIIELVPKLAEAGLDLIKGLWQGISDAASWLWDKISGFFGGIMDKIKGFFGIKSPSKLFENIIGKNLMLGLAEGIEDEAGTVEGAMADIARSIADTDFDIGDISALEGIDTDDVYRRVVSVVGDESGYISKTASVRAAPYHSYSYDEEERNMEGEDNRTPEYIENNIYIDGKEVARVITPYVSTVRLGVTIWL